MLCAVWPPSAPDWVGNPTTMESHGYPMHSVTVCEDLSITDTPQRAL